MSSINQPPKRIVVVGTTGSGKTTLAVQLARHLDVPHIELDSLYWGPHWTPVPSAVFRERVQQAVHENAWVIDGNYSVVRDILWARAEMIVWLDYRLWLILWRLLKRTWRRLMTREELWGTNREQWRVQFTRDSLFVWALKTYWRRRRDYTRLFQQPEYDCIHKIHLRSPRDTEGWLQSFIAAQRY